MGKFDYKSFIDLSQTFSFKTVRACPELVWHADLRKAEPKKTPLKLYAVEGFHPPAPPSKFVAWDVFRPMLKSLFLPLAKPEIKTIGSLATSRFIVYPAAVEAKKPRLTLKLKTNVEVPAIAPGISRNSSTADLAAAFKAEMQMMLKKMSDEPETKPVLEQGVVVVQKPRRATSAGKTWAELLAEAEAHHQKPKVNLDLAAAFKSEMAALLAEQRRWEDTTPVSKPKAAFEQKAAGIPVQAPAPRRATPRTKTPAMVA